MYDPLGIILPPSTILYLRMHWNPLYQKFNTTAANYMVRLTAGVFLLYCSSKIISLKTNLNVVIVFDPTEPDIDEPQFIRKIDLSSNVVNVMNSCPFVLPIPVEQDMRASVDLDHVGDNMTQRLRLCFVVLLNLTSSHWFSMNQTSVQASTFGLEFITKKQCCGCVYDLCYTL